MYEPHIASQLTLQREQCPPFAAVQPTPLCTACCWESRERERSAGDDGQTTACCNTSPKGPRNAHVTPQLAPKAVQNGLIKLPIEPGYRVPDDYHDQSSTKTTVLEACCVWHAFGPFSAGCEKPPRLRQARLVVKRWLKLSTP